MSRIFLHYFNIYDCLTCLVVLVFFVLVLWLSAETKMQINFIGEKQVKIYIPLTNRVRGPYSKLRTEFFPVDLWPARFTLGP